jgi:SPP1 gp7 family putative phage head morphogenesis protein
VAWIPFNLQPIADVPDEEEDSTGANGGATTTDDDTATGDGADDGKHVVGVRASRMLAAPPTQQKSVPWDNYVRTLTPLERQAQNKVKRYLFRQRKEVLTKFYDLAGEHAKSLRKQFDEADLESLFTLFTAENSRLRTVMKPLHALGLDTGALMLYAELNLEPILSVLSDLVGEFITARAALVQGVNETIKNQLRKTLLQGMTTGDSVEALAQRIRDTYNFTQARSLGISRTEMSSAVNAGRYFAMQAENVEGGQWVTAHDERVRLTHKTCDGVVRLLGDRFPNGLRYPGDPQGAAAEVIHCRCFVLAVPKVDTTGDEPVAAS